MALKCIADEYFSNLNPIAARLHQDMDETKQSYESLWETLNDEEKEQILCESIIKPEICLKYISSKEDQTLDWDKVNEYAVKVVLEENCSYRDEHSGPFSFKTKSQHDLTLFGKPKEKKSAFVKDALPNGKSGKKEKKPIVHIEDIEISKCNADGESASGTLPKTGLDFLDNW